MPVLWLLLAAALLLRAAIPSGWMPASTADGVRVLLCTGNGPVELTVPIAGGSHDDGGTTGHGPSRDPCPFGLATGQAFDMPAAVVLSLPPAVLVALVAPARAAVARIVWRSQRPPARGPPFS